MPLLQRLSQNLTYMRGLSPGERRQQIAHYLHTAWCVLTRQNQACPYCGERATTRWGKTAQLQEVRQCPACRLRFTWPKTSPFFNKVFYNWLYAESGPTDLPPPAALAELIACGFRRGSTDFTDRIALVRALRPEGRLLDFGASWGYATWQFARAGYDATGYEPSAPRAAFGRRQLGVRLVDSATELAKEAGTFDVVFSSHVLEHLADPAAAFRLMSSLLKPGGLLIALVPNCDGANARRLGMAWGPLYGTKHVLSLDSTFLARALPRHGFASPLFFSEPYDPARLADDVRAGRGQTEPPGDELMTVAVRGPAELPAGQTRGTV